MAERESRKGPVEETPVEETPVEETPVEETPVENTATPSEELLVVVGELNEKFGLEPPIPMEGSYEQVFAALAQSAKEAVAEDQKVLTPETWSFLQDNNLIDHLPKPKAEAAKAEKPKTEKPAKVAGEKKNNRPPREKRTEWAVGSALSPANAGTKVAFAIDFFKEKGTKQVKLEDLATSVGWSVPLAKAYLTDNIVKLGYGVKLNEDGTFDLLMPKGAKIPAHAVKDSKKK